MVKKDCKWEPIKHDRVVDIDSILNKEKQLYIFRRGNVKITSYFFLTILKKCILKSLKILFQFKKSNIKYLK